MSLCGIEGIAQTAGTLDPTFQSPIGVKGQTVFVTKVLSDGKILVGGDFKQFNNRGTATIARLNANGSLDTTFNVAIGPDDSISGIVVQPDGKYLVSGDFSTFSGLARNGLVRLNTDGSVDPTLTLGIPNVVFGSRVMAALSDGKILLAVNSKLYRLLADGSIDPTFNNNAPLNVFPYELKTLFGGQFLICGSFNDGNRTIDTVRRYFADGRIDTSFQPPTFAGSVFALAVQINGLIVCGGDFDGVGGNTNLNGLVRLNSNGQVDTGFTPTGFTNDSIVFDIGIQPDGAFSFAEGIYPPVLGSSGLPG